MGMFDTVRVINVAHKDFPLQHNGESFQTKSLACDMSDYYVFYGKLYQEIDGSKDCTPLDNPLPKDFSGELNIYTEIVKNGIEQWLEYDLTFVDGELTAVKPYPIHGVIQHRNVMASDSSNANAENEDKLRIFLDEFS